MADTDARAYVTAATALLGLDLRPARVPDIVEAFAQLQRFAAPALAADVPHDRDEPDGKPHP